jgi:hypothetical protein
MPNKNTLWTLRESHRHGLTRELLNTFRQRAEADGIETVTALVQVMREYIARPHTPTEAAPTSDQVGDGSEHEGTVRGR